MDLFDLCATIVMDMSDYEKGVKSTESGFEKLKSGFSNVKKVAVGIGAVVTTVTGILTKVGIESAAEIRAETSAFQQTFGDMQDAASEAIGRVADNAGILETRLNTLGSQIYAFARSSGGDATESLTLMERALQVAADTAAYYDTSVEQATQTLQSFLKGNYENDAALGLSATETTRNAAAMELFGQKFQNLTEIQKQETLLKMVEDAQALSGAMGQATREADGWENVIGNLTESWRQLKGRIGEPVLDTVTPIVKDATEALTYLEENWDDVEHAIGTATAAVGSMAAAMGALYAGQKLKSLADAFTANAKVIALLREEVGKTAFQQGVLSGTFSVSKIAVGVLTGKISLATAAQYAWNTAMNANPIGLVIAAVGLLGTTVYNNVKKIDTLADSMAGQASTAEEARQKLEELQEKFAEFEGSPYTWGEGKRQEYFAVKQAIEETEAQLEELLKTETEAATAAAEAAADPVNVFQKATEQYAQDATALYEKFVETYEGMYDQVSGWFQPFEGASTSVTTSIDEMMAAMQSQIEFNDAYSANLQALKEYGLGSLSEAFQSYGANGAAYAQAIVEAVEQAGGATTQEGQEIIQGFADVNQKLTESQGELAETMTQMNGEFDTALQDLADSYSEAISDLDKGEDAKSAAETTFQSFLDGVNSKIPGILDAMSGLGEKITSSIQGSIGSITVPVSTTINGSASGNNATFSLRAGGLDYVPYNGYIAELHRGETVLSESEAEDYRRGSFGSRIVQVIQHIHSEAKSAADLMEEARYEQEKAVLLGV